MPKKKVELMRRLLGGPKDPEWFPTYDSVSPDDVTDSEDEGGDGDDKRVTSVRGEAN